MRLDEAKARACQYFERLLNGRDISVCDEMLAPEYVDHDAPLDTPPGAASIKAFVVQFLEDYPDLEVEIEAVIAEGDQVGLRIVWRGTHQASGVALHQRGIILLRLNEAGQLVERWSSYREL